MFTQHVIQQSATFPTIKGQAKWHHIFLSLCTMKGHQWFQNVPFCCITCWTNINKDGSYCRRIKCAARYFYLIAVGPSKSCFSTLHLGVHRSDVWWRYRNAKRTSGGWDFGDTPKTMQKQKNIYYFLNIKVYIFITKSMRIFLSGPPLIQLLFGENQI